MVLQDIVETVAQLRSIVPLPAGHARDKVLGALDHHCRAIIERCPFVVIASGTATGALDISPKGDAPGFVAVLDDRTIAIPDRPGNRRADTFTNVLSQPDVAILFVVPGRAETLRVNGRAVVCADERLRRSLAVAGKLPQLVLVVHVDEVFVHCGKCMLRSRLWQPQTWPPAAELPSHARCLADHARTGVDVAELERQLRENYGSNLY